VGNGTSYGRRDGLVIDMARRRVTVNGMEIKLTPTEYDLMKNLASHAGKVLTHRQLLRTVWGPSYENDTHYLRGVHRPIAPEN